MEWICKANNWPLIVDFRLYIEKIVSSINGNNSFVASSALRWDGAFGDPVFDESRKGAPSICRIRQIISSGHVQ